MIAPWIFFAFGVLGLISGGGIAVLSAPAAWFVSGVQNAPPIIAGQVCVINALIERTSP